MIGTLCLLLLLTALTTPGYTARILGVAPFPAPSHQILLTSLFKELANRGHHLTVITPLPLKEGNPPNYVEIDTGITHPPGFGDDSNNMFEVGEISPYMLFLMMWNMGPEILESTFENPDVQNLLHSKTEKFDLLLTETFFNEAILGLAHKFNVPIISVCTFAGFESIGDAAGNPSPYSYVPNALTELTTHMSFLERLQNTLLNTYVNLGHYLYYLPKQNELLVKYFKDTAENLPYVDELVKRTSLVFLNNHFSYSFPRPYVPNIVEVGGLHVKPAKKLPQKLMEALVREILSVVKSAGGLDAKERKELGAREEGGDRSAVARLRATDLTVTPSQDVCERADLLFEYRVTVVTLNLANELINLMKWNQ
uniref:Uncharacterized protein n=1 Tax=Timema poppense TaxID=170557 RepID=A0A7R9DQI7_TIMPO|nr:unnamed protein product [Timema poppensis]